MKYIILIISLFLIGCENQMTDEKVNSQPKKSKYEMTCYSGNIKILTAYGNYGTCYNGVCYVQEEISTIKSENATQSNANCIVQKQ